MSYVPKSFNVQNVMRMDVSNLNVEMANRAQMKSAMIITLTMGMAAILNAMLRNNGAVMEVRPQQ